MKREFTSVEEEKEYYENVISHAQQKLDQLEEQEGYAYEDEGVVELADEEIYELADEVTEDVSGGKIKVVNESRRITTSSDVVSAYRSTNTWVEGYRFIRSRAISNCRVRGCMIYRNKYGHASAEVVYRNGNKEYRTRYYIYFVPGCRY